MCAPEVLGSWGLPESWGVLEVLWGPWKFLVLGGSLRSGGGIKVVAFSCWVFSEFLRRLPGLWGFWRPLGDLEGSAGLFLGPPILFGVWSPEGLRLQGDLAQEFLLLGLQHVHFL